MQLPSTLQTKPVRYRRDPMINFLSSIWVTDYRAKLSRSKSNVIRVSRGQKFFPHRAHFLERGVHAQICSKSV